MEHNVMDGCVASTTNRYSLDASPNAERDLADPYYYDLRKFKKAHIFNHYSFDQNAYKRAYKMSLSERVGTDIDRNSIRSSLTTLGFHVNVYEDYSASSIFSKCSEIADEKDNTDTSCLVVVIMTHGQKDGKLCAYDAIYNLNDIISFFTASSAETLVSVPKIFFIQACRGDSFDDGHIVADGQVTSGGYAIKISNHADILIMYSTYPDHVSIRPWFIRTLAQELEEKYRRWDLMSILTFVIGVVSRQRETGLIYDEKNKEYLYRQKQTPQIVSTLRKLLDFGARKYENDP